MTKTRAEMLVAAVLLSIVAWSVHAWVEKYSRASIEESAARTGLTLLKQEGQMVVSERPVTEEMVASLRFGDWNHSCWDGVVLVRRDDGSYGSSASVDGEHVRRWGELLVFGDPEVALKLVGR